MHTHTDRKQGVGGDRFKKTDIFCFALEPLQEKEQMFLKFAKSTKSPSSTKT